MSGIDDISVPHSERIMGTSSSLPTAIAAATVALISMAALFLTHHAGWTLYYGDAEAHLNHARRIWDSQTPGWEQLGTVWLPLPHLLMLPFVANRSLWQTGMAGAIPASICFVAASTFLFAAVRLLLNSVVLATAATALFVLSPNMLYLQAVPMTESVFFLAVLGILYFLASFQQDQSIASVFGVALMVLAGTLTRYEGWLLFPLAGLILLAKASRKRAEIMTLFVSVAAIGPLAWMAYNWWITGNALDFYNGPYSPKAIQGAAPYPGEVRPHRIAATPPC